MFPRTVYEIKGVGTTINKIGRNVQLGCRPVLDALNIITLYRYCDVEFVRIDRKDLINLTRYQYHL